LIVDEDKALTADIISALLQLLNTQLLTISPYNHGSSKAERQIKTVSTIINKSLTEKGTGWPSYCYLAAAAANFFRSEALDGLSPYELVFLRPTPNLFSQHIPQLQNDSVTHKQYLASLLDKKAYMESVFHAFRTQQAIDRKHASQRFVNIPTFQVNDLVALYAPHASSLQTNTRKFRRDWIGPLSITAVHGDHSYSLKDIATQQDLVSIYPVHRLKRWTELSPSLSLINNQDDLLSLNDSLPPASAACDASFGRPL
jgi:hypothetical protein